MTGSSLFTCRHCVVSLVSDGIQRSSQWENETTIATYCWQTSFIIWSHLSPTGEHTCFAGTATVNRSPHRHSSRCCLEALAGSSTEKLAAASGKDIGLFVGAAWIAGQDRSMWRTLRPSAGQAQQWVSEAWKMKERLLSRKQEVSSNSKSRRMQVSIWTPWIFS